MGVVTKTRVLSAAVMLSVGTLWPFPSQADQHSDQHSQADYTVISPGASAVGFVTTDSVPIQVTGPSDSAVRRSKLTLNGRNVTMSLSQGGTGVVSGLKSDRILFSYSRS